MDRDAQEKATFITGGCLWTLKVLPFGRTSAPANFEHLMERMLKGLQRKALLLYLNGVMVFFTDFDIHVVRLEEIL